MTAVHISRRIQAMSLAQVAEQAAIHPTAAVAIYQVWLSAHGQSAGAAAGWFNLGVLLAAQGGSSTESAAVAYRQAIALQPSLYPAVINLALLLEGQTKPSEALKVLQTGLQHAPQQPLLLNHLARVWMARKDYAAALPLLTQSVSIQSDQPDIWEQLMFLRARLCVWPVNGPWAEWPFGVSQSEVLQHAGPFGILMMSDDPLTQKQAVQASVKRSQLLAPRAGLVIRKMAGEPPKPRPQRLRIGYVSADFCNHATSCLMAQLLESHDPERFEIFAYSWSPDDRSALRSRVRTAFNAPHGGFHEIAHLSDAQAAALIASHGIDIAVDLKGHTQSARPGIFAHRPAPLQVNYLGYPGSMQLPFIDAIVADSVLIEPADEAHYSERVVRLPGSYQCNDNTRTLGAKPSRTALGLPESGRVLAAMNATFKFTPEVFAIWMRLLRAHPDTVLWMHAGAAAGLAVNHLREAACAAGVRPERLVFAPSVSPAEHLTRLQVADLFLDNWPCNAHTTASDALWAGVPVLTCKGNSFASRVGASLLQALGLPELITHDLASYEAQALRLLGQPKKLSALRQKLWHARSATDVFDGVAFARKLEAAYDGMWRDL